jgi:hypothetical protein
MMGFGYIYILELRNKRGTVPNRSSSDFGTRRCRHHLLNLILKLILSLNNNDHVKHKAQIDAYHLPDGRETS